MLPSCCILLTVFKTVLVFALGPFLPMLVIFFGKMANMAKMAIYGHLAIGPCATNSGKWGIPEKSYKNVAQQ